MKITNVECFVLLVPDVEADACSSAQDNAVVRITTDTGIVGIGETDTNPWAVKALIDAPSTHCMGLGFKDMLLGEDPRRPEELWEKLYTGSAMYGRRGLGVCAIGAIDMALWDICGKAAGRAGVAPAGRSQAGAAAAVCQPVARWGDAGGLHPQPGVQGAAGGRVRVPRGEGGGVPERALLPHGAAGER